MKDKGQGAASTTTPNYYPENISQTTTKVNNSKDIIKVLDYFRYTTATTLDCMLSTGVPRNSITWYVVDLMNEGLLQVVYKRADIHTGRIAQYYSADENKWTKPRYKEGRLWT